MDKKPPTLPPLATVNDLADWLGVSSLVYRRSFLTRHDHPQPVFNDRRPLRFRSGDICQWLGVNGGVNHE